jgi:general secretion pathway protein C
MESIDMSINLKDRVFDILLAILLAKVSSIAITSYLPQQSIEYNPSASHSIEYHTYNVSNIIKGETTVVDSDDVVTESIDSFKLEGIFRRSRGGYIVVSDTKSSSILSINEHFKGYKLIAIKDTQAIFEKRAKKYTLSIRDKIAIKSQNRAYTSSISKQTLLYYSKDVSNILKEIYIKRVSKGYKVVNIKKGTVFQRVGLQRGDILLALNDKPLSANIDILAIAKVIKSKHIKLDILRDNKQKQILLSIAK